MIFPQKLKAGSCIGLVSPSSPVSEERISLCIRTLKSMGFKVKPSDNSSMNYGGYMAGDARTRGEWINKMFADPEVDAIFCVRGGDGGNRIVPFINTDIVKANPKPFVGYSDITTLHLLFNQKCDLVTFHGPMVSSNICADFDEASKLALFSCINADSSYEYIAPDNMPVKVARSGKAEGIMTGGNVTVLCAAIGTPYAPDLDGKILFLEDVSEHIGNFDRNIYHLRNAGLLDNVKGIVLGQFTNCRLDAPDYLFHNVILDAIGDMNIPVIYEVQSGHGSPMITLPMGAVCRIDTSLPSLTFSISR